MFQYNENKIIRLEFVNFARTNVILLFKNFNCVTYERQKVKLMTRLKKSKIFNHTQTFITKVKTIQMSVFFL